MAGLANLDDEKALAPALGLLQLSSNDFDEQIAQLPSEGSASANHISRPCTPTSNEKDDLVLASRLSLLPSEDFDEQVSRPHRTRSASASEEARSSTPSNESGEDNVELALILSQLPAEIFDEQVRGLNQRRESSTGIKDNPASFRTAMSLVQVRTAPSLIP
jgi:hypothetical protein